MNAESGDIIANINDLIQKSRDMRSRIAGTGVQNAQIPSVAQPMQAMSNVPASLTETMGSAVPVASAPVPSLATQSGFVDLHTPQDYEIHGGGNENIVEYDENPVTLDLNFDISDVVRAIHNFDQIGGRSCGCGCDNECDDDELFAKDSQNGGGCGCGGPPPGEDIFAVNSDAQNGGGCGTDPRPRYDMIGGGMVASDVLRVIDSDMNQVNELLGKL